MTSDEQHKNFIAFMERTRYEEGLTIPQMAKWLGLSEEKYKNIIYGRTKFIDIDIACRLYELTGAWMWQMIGYSHTDSEVINIYLSLNERDKWLIKSIAESMRKTYEM